MPFKRWLPNVLLALAVAAVVLTFPALSQPTPCIPLTVILAKIGDDTRLVDLRILEGAKLSIAAKTFNEATENNIPWSAAYLARRDDGWAVLVVGFQEYVCASVMMDKNGLRLFLKAIDGEAA